MAGDFHMGFRVVGLQGFRVSGIASRSLKRRLGFRVSGFQVQGFRGFRHCQPKLEAKAGFQGFFFNPSYSDCERYDIK